MGTTLFPREDDRTVRVEDLKLMFAMVKRRKVSPVKFMMLQWSEIFKRKGNVKCSSLVTRLANSLGLMENSLVTYIAGDRPFITIDHFRQGQSLKGGKNNTAISMIYRGQATEIPLPNPGLGLYAMNSFIVLPLTAAVGRSASARLGREPPAHYYGADPTPQGPAYTAYQTFGQARSSRGVPAAHNPWERTSSQHSEGSWQQASSGQWRQGHFDYYQGSGRYADMQEASSSGGVHIQPGCASYSDPSYHDFHMERQEIRTRLRGIEETQAEIQ